MRRSEKGITDAGTLERLLDTLPVLRLAFHDKPAPYILPLFFAREGRTLYAHAAVTGKKLDLLTQNPSVGFEADHCFSLVEVGRPCGIGASYASVIGSGRAARVEDKAEKSRALDAVMRKYADSGPYQYSEKSLNTTAVIRIDIIDMSGKQSGQPDLSKMHPLPIVRK